MQTISDQNTQLRRNEFITNTKQENQQNLAYHNIGHWLEEEHQRFLIFLEKERISTQSNKRQFQFFKRMSNFVQTRSQSQCRSHHQKFNPIKKKSDSDSLQVDEKPRKKIVREISIQTSPGLYHEYVEFQVQHPTDEIQEPLFKQIQQDRMSFYNVGNRETYEEYYFKDLISIYHPQD